MKFQLSIFVGLFLILLTSCGPAVIVPVQTPTIQVTASLTLPPSTATVVVPTGTVKPNFWDLCAASPINCINDITIDPEGYLWAATEFGVIYWDLIGRKFVYAELISHVIFDATQDKMNSIVIADDGTVLARSNKGIVFSFQSRKWVEKKIITYFARSLSLQPDGSVWVPASSEGVYYYRNGTWTHDGLPSQFKCGVGYITSDLGGNIWAVDTGCYKSPSFLRKFGNGHWEQIEDYSPSQLLFNGETIWFEDFYTNDDRVCQILLDGRIECFNFPGRMWYEGILFGKEDEIWIRSIGDNSIWHLDHGKWNKLDLPTITGDYVLSLYITPDGGMFIGTAGQGIIQYDGKIINKYYVNYIPGE